MRSLRQYIATHDRPATSAREIIDADPGPMVTLLRLAVYHARTVERMTFDEGVRSIWHTVYADLSEGKPGLLGSVTARSEAQTVRLACIYALLDLSPVIRSEHLLAALEVWRYADHSARFIFGDSLGDPVADEILKLLRENPAGVTRNEITDHFGRNKSARVIGNALRLLADGGLVYSEKDTSMPTKPAIRWFGMATDASERPMSGEPK